MNAGYGTKRICELCGFLIFTLQVNHINNYYLQDKEGVKSCKARQKKNINFSGPPASLFGCWAFFFFF